MASQRIPLFPLDVVLFPGMPLPLHIFEPRYKLMIRRCVDYKLKFGMLLAREEGAAGVGCTAAIVEVVRTYPDGKLDILTEGREAYRILEVFEGKPYLEAEVEFLTDEVEAAPEHNAESLKLLDLYRQCHALVFGRPADAIEPHREKPLSFQIASKLPLPLDERQELLEMRRESDRQARLAEHLREWITQLEQTQKMRRKAVGNGHGLT
jgi:Lon protease-like protein